MELEEERADDIVQAGAQSAASDNAGARLRGIEEELGAWAGQLKLDTRLTPDFNVLRDADVIANGAVQRRTEAWNAESGSVHGMKYQNS
jgi:hypothetical protein